MSEWRDELRATFEDAGWQEQSIELLQNVESFDGLFSGSFAICAIVSSQSSSQAIENWEDIQGALAELRGNGTLAKSKDLYILFIVETVDENALSDLQKILDNPRVCRKICLERRERTIAETLDDVPFFSTPGLPVAAEDAASELIDVLSVLPELIQSDLERRSAEHILNKLVNGKYEVD